ncbi:MAG: ankyrin repeat domain-containing protein [Pseudomonadota bacterium]
MKTPPHTDLLRAVLNPRKPGALKAINEACTAGADPNALLSVDSTDLAPCPVRIGSTLLTHSIGQDALNAVKALLACGADPNRADSDGWTPWMASTLADESKRDRIQAALLEHGAKTSGEHIGSLISAIYDGDVAAVPALIESDDDMAIVATFRVDLVGHHVDSGNVAMLSLLAEHGMHLQPQHLTSAIRTGNATMVDLILRNGIKPERDSENETGLMKAAMMGRLDIVQLLVNAGADVNRSAFADRGEIEWTASTYARRSGHKHVSDWLIAQMSNETRAKLDALNASRDRRFFLLYEHGTAGENTTTDEIVATLGRWDDRYGVTTNEATADSLSITFTTLPESLHDLGREILELCPDAEDDPELLTTLAKAKTLFLWWD